MQHDVFHVQVEPGVIAVITSGLERFLTPSPVPAEVAHAPAEASPQAQALIAALSAATLPVMPGDLQIVLLPGSARSQVAALAGAAPIPASYNLSVLAGYYYTVEPSSLGVPALPAGLAAISPQAGAALLHPPWGAQSCWPALQASPTDWLVQQPACFLAEALSVQAARRRRPHLHRRSSTGACCFLSACCAPCHCRHYRPCSAVFPTKLGALPPDFRWSCSSMVCASGCPRGVQLQSVVRASYPASPPPYLLRRTYQPRPDCTGGGGKRAF